jgi:hypothetical protein
MSAINGLETPDATSNRRAKHRQKLPASNKVKNGNSCQQQSVDRCGLYKIEKMPKKVTGTKINERVGESKGCTSQSNELVINRKAIQHHFGHVEFHL